MNTQPDFEEFLSLLQKHRVDYMLVGGYAVAFHGHPRFTKDLDIFYRNTPDNTARPRNALVDFGFNREEVEGLALEKDGEIIRFGTDPVMIDLINMIDGVAYGDAAPHVVHGTYGSIPALFICKQHLLINKRSTPRLQDKADVEQLE